MSRLQKRQKRRSGGIGSSFMMWRRCQQIPNSKTIDARQTVRQVGAKIEVYNVMNALAKQWKCVIMISSELPEILGMCGRVLVMREGEKMAEIDRGSQYFNQEDMMKAAWGGKLEWIQKKTEKNKNTI